MKKGFTLLEIMVSITIFVIIVTIATGAFIIMARLQRKTLIMREVEQNSRVALESISKDAREAKQVTASGSTLTLQFEDRAQITYSLSNNKIYKKVGSLATDANLPITDSTRNTLKITDLQFIQAGDLLAISFNADDNNGPTLFEQDSISVKTAIYLEGL